MDTPVVLITGGLTGIGRGAAFAFAKKGAKVVVAGRHDDAGQTLVQELRSLGAEAELVKADVRNENDVRNMVDKAVDQFGRLDIAANSAGTKAAVGPITDLAAEDVASAFDTNVLGVLLSIKHAIYVGAKHTVEGITKSVALELAASENSRERGRAWPHGYRNAQSLQCQQGNQR